MEYELEYDLGRLTAYSPEPVELPKLKSSKYESEVRGLVSRQATTLLRQIYKLDAVTSTTAIQEGVQGALVQLPEPVMALPRAKPLPEAKPLTKWEKFAAARGIKPKSKTGKLKYDSASAEWVSKWGHGSRREEDEWIVEVPGKSAVGEQSDNIRADMRRARKNNARENDTKRHRNMLPGAGKVRKPTKMHSRRH